jgi:hypothetical protein
MEHAATPAELFQIVISANIRKKKNVEALFFCITTSTSAVFGQFCPTDPLRPSPRTF